MDVALAIEYLVPGAGYGGSTTANTREAYDALRWEDGRKKPTWEEVEAAWAKCAPREEALREIERLEISITPRRQREAMSDEAGGSAAGRAWMADTVAKIKAERAKL